MAVKKHTKKKQKIRHNEYYGTQSVFDDLYCESKNGKKFRNLMGLITSEQNVLLAYRNIVSVTSSARMQKNKKMSYCIKSL